MKYFIWISTLLASNYSFAKDSEIDSAEKAFKQAKERRTICEKGAKSSIEKIFSLENSLKAKKKTPAEAYSFLSNLSPAKQSEVMAKLISTRNGDAFYLVDDPKTKEILNELALEYTRKDAFEAACAEISIIIHMLDPSQPVENRKRTGHENYEGSPDGSVNPVFAPSG